MKEEGSIRFGRAREANKETFSCRHFLQLGQHGALETIQIEAFGAVELLTIGIWTSPSGE